MFSVVSKTFFVIVLVCAVLSCYEARPEGDDPPADGDATSAAPASTATTGGDAGTAAADAAAVTASPGDAGSTAASSSPSPDGATAAEGGDRRK